MDFQTIKVKFSINFQIKSNLQSNRCEILKKTTFLIEILKEIKFAIKIVMKFERNIFAIDFQANLKGNK